MLLVLATYADNEGWAWPSIKTLALDCGLRPTKDGRNSAISRAIQRLEDLKLVFTKQGGHGSSARRALQFNPAKPNFQAEQLEADRDLAAFHAGGRQVDHQGYASEEGSPAETAPQPSALPDGYRTVGAFQPSVLASSAFRAEGPQPSSYEDPNGQENGQLNGQEELPKENGQKSLPPTRKASGSRLRKAEPHKIGAFLDALATDAGEEGTEDE